jgi:uncharacterized protein (DUF1778 family)
MQATREPPTMAKKKSESRKHTAMIRVDEEARRQAMLAAAMAEMSLADFATEVLKMAAKQKIDEWTARRSAGEKPPKPKGGKP